MTFARVGNLGIFRSYLSQNPGNSDDYIGVFFPPSGLNVLFPTLLYVSGFVSCSIFREKFFYECLLCSSETRLQVRRILPFN